MRIARTMLAAVFTLAFAAPLAAQETAGFVVRLGVDTTGVERYTRTAGRIEVDQIGRSPRVLQRHYVYDLDNGAVSHLSLTVTAPGNPTPVQTIEASVTADSILMEIKGNGPTQNPHLALPPGTLVVTGSSPWVMYEGLAMRMTARKADSVRTTMYFLGAPGPNWLRVRRLGRDSIEISNEHQDVFHARLDRAGHILGVLPISGTGKFAVTRVASVDVAATAAAYAAREKQAGAMGALSTRDTVRVADAGGAALWIDYGRPAKRGRAVFGNVVPFGEVWRTGANAATQFRTDKALDFGGMVVPAGFYTLWTVPSPSGWKLVINSETGQWGTMHDAAKDLYTLDMSVSALPDPVERFTIGVEPRPQGGVLNMDWDTTRASIAFTTKP